MSDLVKELRAIAVQIGDIGGWRIAGLKIMGAADEIERLQRANSVDAAMRIAMTTGPVCPVARAILSEALADRTTDEPAALRGKPCTCSDTAVSACGVAQGDRLGELWYCRRAAQEPSDVTCPRCKGSGTIEDGGIPDGNPATEAFDIDCDRCGGTGAIPAAETTACSESGVAVGETCPHCGGAGYYTAGGHASARPCEYCNPAGRARD